MASIHFVFVLGLNLNMITMVILEMLIRTLNDSYQNIVETMISFTRFKFSFFIFLKRKKQLKKKIR